MGALGFGVFFYGIYRLYKYLQIHDHASSVMSESFANEADISR